jgi:trimeric autotransporter adhesin
MRQFIRLFCSILCLAVCGPAAASQYGGQVTFGGLPVPGVTVTVMMDDKMYSTITDQQGFYTFPDLTDGTWMVKVEMTGFFTINQDTTIAANAPLAKWELKMLSPGKLVAQQIKPVPEGYEDASASIPAREKPSTESELSVQNGGTGKEQSIQDSDQRTSGGFLINGSVNNGAASPFAQPAAFGNSRPRGKGLYDGDIGIIFNNSALDANPFSLSGLSSPKPAYNQMTGIANFGGPLRIPHLLKDGPIFFVGYQWTRNNTDTTQSALVPTLEERSGNLSQTLNTAGQPVQVFDPITGIPFAGGRVPISFQAQTLLDLYPKPNVTGTPHYNYQIPIVSGVHQDALNSRLSKTLGRNDQVYGSFAFRGTRASNPTLLGFLDTEDSLGLDVNMNWAHQFERHVFQTVEYQFSRLATEITPYWQDRENVSGEAGIAGNDQDPTNWGPPTLTFSSGLVQLSDAQSSHNRNQTGRLSYTMLWIRNKHEIIFGGDFRRQQFNYLSQQDPRGILTFTGAATEGIVNGIATGGSDFADFLLGIPDTSSIAFGNADKYLRESGYDAYISDDWRVGPQFTVAAGIRWEYDAPVTELFGRLVNLDVTPGFGAIAPVVANDPIGPLTGRGYPNSLIWPDKRGFEPRVGIAWRPFSDSSTVVRAGYGIYRDTSVYQTIALQMAQQAPLSKSLTLGNSPVCPLTLANPFISCPVITADTFAIDPNFRIGYAQNWQLALQRDLPGSLQVTATYLGIKGTRGIQVSLPNTFPIGATSQCLTCPTGFAYLTSNGNSTRESGQIQLRRRLHNGLTGTIQYAFSKSIDDDSALGGRGAIAATQNNPTVGAGTPTSYTIAQNWLDLSAERSVSSFDQRHTLNVQLQYTSGMGLGGGTLLNGWKGILFKEWTFLAQIAVGSGLPETPVYFSAVPGTGVTGSIRPDYTGAPLYSAQPGLFLNSAAYTVPLPGQWGNASRDSIVGPAQFILNASMGRTFRLKSRLNLDLQINSTNLLNHVTFTNLNTTINSTQFGLPTASNPMRSVQTTLRVRF